MPAKAQEGGDYQATIQKADSYFQQQDYYNAKATYQLALKIKPNEAHPKQRIAEIIGLLKAQMGVQAEYDEHISTADEAMATHDYATAITHYQKASTLLPQETYPKTQLQAAQTAQAAAAKQKADYEKAIAQGDSKMQASAYPEALLFYRHAAKTDPSQDYPQQQIQKINALMKQQANAAQNYQTAIRQGDQHFNYMKYADALSAYQQALAAKPQDSYAQQQIQKAQVLAKTERRYDSITAIGDKQYMAQQYKAAKTTYEQARPLLPKKQYAINMIAKVEAAINKQAAAYAAQEAAYQAIIQEADALMKQKKYQEAIDKYQEAQQMRPAESYPPAQIEKAQALIDQQQEYMKLIAAGDTKYQAQDYDKALYDYYAAKNLKPHEAYPQQKIAEIDAIINKQKSLEANYKAKVSAADSLLQMDSLQMAQSSYQAALQLKPQAPYPQQKLNEITATLQARAQTDKAYKQAIDKADKLFAANKLSKAKAAYQEALTIKPQASYPKYKIEDINTIEEQGRQRQQQADYDKLIAEADAAFHKKAYAAALPLYEQAHLLQPKEGYPPAQIDKINQLLAQAKQQTADYQKLIQQADEAFTQKDYTQALQHYKAALAIKPQESYPQQRIKEIEQLLAQQAEQAQRYQSLIALGDSSFQSKLYHESLDYFSAAAKLKPQESYPPQKIAEIQALLANAEQADKAYNEAIKQADTHYHNNSWQAALSKYELALSIKPEEMYPKARIQKLKALLAEQLQLQASYDSLIALADEHFHAQRWPAAKPLYTQAKTLQPKEAYPPAQLKEISRLMAEAANKDKAYNKLIAEADTYFDKKGWSKAMDKYTAALAIKAAAIYPKEQINIIKDKMASAANKQQQYQQLIRTADSLFENKVYEAALLNYETAATIYPKEPYPPKQITRIQQLLAAQVATAAQYAQLIRQGDSLFQGQAYAAALAPYQEAKTLKPQESYPPAQILKIEQLMAKERQYQQLIQTGDKAFTQQTYSEALQAFKEALQLKPQQAYPKQKISEIEGILQSAEALEQAYAQAIAQGDAAFEKAAYPQAQKAYNTALSLKAQEPYPKAQLAEIEKRLAAQAQLNKDYNKLIAKGDALFNKAQWEAAQAPYQSALQLKPSEAYPQQQLDKIAQQLQSAADKEAAYAQAIAQGDAAMQNQSYAEAITAYTAALQIFNKAYPKRRIAEAQAALDKLQQLSQARYNAVIAEGDRHFKAHRWTAAIAAYQQALDIKPEASYPQNKIKEIEQLMAAEAAALRQKYDTWLSQGDKAYKQKVYQKAIRCYQEALNILPQETYPQQQIDAIMELLEQASNVTLLDKEISLQAGQIKHFTFAPIPYKDRDNSYILLEIQQNDNTQTTKVKLDFGENEGNLGGFSFKLHGSQQYHLYFINLSEQGQWQSHNNNFINILSEKNAIKIKTVKIGRFN